MESTVPINSARAVGMALGMVTIAGALGYAMLATPWRILVAIPLPAVWTYTATLNAFWLVIAFAGRRLLQPQDAAPPASGATGAFRLHEMVEQTLLALVTSGLLILSHASHAAMLVAVHACIFALSRLVLWRGHRNGWMLVYGLTLALGTSVALYAYTVYFLARAIR